MATINFFSSGKSSSSVPSSASYFYFQKHDPKKIIFARELRGLTKKELAEKIERTPSHVTQFENEKCAISFEVFQKLCEVLSFPPSFFSKESVLLPNASLGLCHFRANQRVPQKKRIQVLAYAELVMMIFDYLEETFIKFPIDSVPRCEDDITESQIESFTVEVRKQLGLGLGPINNMAKLLEGIGVRIILFPHDEVNNLDGFATWINGRPCIMVDASAPASRMQFDYAHEFAHLVLDENSPIDSSTVERRANRFASSFLMPYASFKRECPNRYTSSIFCAVKQRWYVSIAAALYRARQLGVMSEYSYTNAMKSRSKKFPGTDRSLRVNEECEFQHPMPSLLNKAFELICGEVGLEEIAERIGVTVSCLYDILKLQNVSEDVLGSMMPTAKKGKIFDFVCVKRKEADD